MLVHLYNTFGKNAVRVTAAVVLILLVSLIWYFSGKVATVETVVQQKATVTVKTVSDIVFKNSFSTIGTVQAISEARLQTEAGGRITRVSTEIGKAVSAGTIIATIENSAESATLLQAQGAYEAALAGAASGGVGVSGAQSQLDSAKSSGLTTYLDAFIGFDSIIHTTLDPFFTMTNGKATLRIDGKGQSWKMNESRTEIESIFETWKKSKNTVSKDSVLNSLEQSYADTTKLAILVESLAVLAQNQDVTFSFNQTQKDTLVATILGARNAVSGLLKQEEGAKSAITGATKALQQAQIAGGDGTVSASNAQVKIALGSLRAAQANYERTIVRTPISGVVNALYLKTGEYVSPSQPAAIVANNKGLQIETSVSQEDALQLQVGDSVTIDKTATGTISAIAGAIDPTTGKVALKISIEDNGTLQNGATTAITFTAAKKTTTVAPDITIPLAAVKMTGSGPVVFTVDATTNTLTALSIVLGAISGENVLVSSGLSSETSIVTDGRGLKAGQEVIVATK